MWSKLRGRLNNSDSQHWTESHAARYLKDQGLHLKEKNYRCKLGEIDLIMVDRDNTLVFVEVRYRKQHRFGTPLETIDFNKQQKLVRAATHYLQQKNLLDCCPCRFDVVAVTTIDTISDETDVNWIKNAF